MQDRPVALAIFILLTLALSLGCAATGILGTRLAGQRLQPVDRRRAPVGQEHHLDHFADPGVEKEQAYRHAQRAGRDSCQVVNPAVRSDSAAFSASLRALCASGVAAAS